MLGKSLAALLVLCTFSIEIFAQVSTSRVIGTVTDPSGAAVANADVELKNEGTSISYHTKTSSSGNYAFDSISTGRYTVTVEAQGFQKLVSTGNLLTVGQPMTVNASLQIGGVTQEVQVSSSADLVQTSTSGNTGNVLGEKEIKDLPIVGTRGRNPLDLVLLQPGVVQGSNTGGGVHVHGARDRSWNFTLDGIDNNDVSAGGANFSPTRANPDSLSEYRVITSNPTAENGRNSGGNVVLATKSGTNQFHGSGFWFYRTPSLNANEWENNLQDLGKTQFVQNIYGGSIGGPIWKNHTFFFFNLQRLAAHDTTSINRTVYTQTARQGIWRYATGGRNRPFGVQGASVDAAGNVAPGVNIGNYNVVANDPQHIGIDPRIASEIGNTPLPNNFTGGDGLNTAYYTFAGKSIEEQQDNTVKIDHVFNERHSVFFRAAWGFQNSNCDAVNDGLEYFPGTGCVVDTKRSPRNLAFSWRSVISPSFTNELVVGQSNFTFNFLSPLAQQGDTYIVIDPVPPVDVIGSQRAIGNGRTLNTNQIVDNASFFHGAHFIKFGVNLRYTSHKDDRGSIAAENANQGVDFSTSVNPVDPVAFNLPGNIQTSNDLPALQNNVNFLLGRVGRTARGFSSDGTKFVPGNYLFKANYKETDYYIQDTWKINKRLTLDLGLRLEMKFTPTESQGRVLRPNQPLVYGAAPTDSAQWVKGSLFQSSLNNFGPSIGFAYDPFGDGKTVIRSNYRIAYDRLNTFVLSSSVFQNLPGVTFAQEDTTFGVNGGRLSNLPTLEPPTTSPDSLTQPPAFSNSSITVVDPNLKTPTTHMWSFGIQRDIGKQTVFSADYFGRRAYHLYGAYDANQVEIQSNGFLQAFNTAASGGESPVLDQITAHDTRRNSNESGAAFIRRQYPSDVSLGSVGAVAGSLAQQSGGAQFFRRFPQYQRVITIDTNDFSTYHGLELQVLRRFTSGLEAQFSYTWSKSLDSRSFDPAFSLASTGNLQSASSTPFDIANRKLNYARSDFDRRHAFNAYWVAELPFGRGKIFGRNANALVDRIIGGWQLSGFFYYYTGRPFTAYSGIYTYSNVVNSTANCTGCSQSAGSLFTDPATGYAYYFNEQDRSQFSTPAPGVPVGTTPRNFFQTQGWFDLDASLSKRTKITETTNLEIRADATNLTNTPQWDNPTASIQSAAFGQLYTPRAGRARKIQIGAKFNF